MLPNSIEILEHIIKVDGTPDATGSTDELFGSVRIAKQQMYINVSNGPDVQAQTILHECVHTICALTGIDMDEHMVDLMALGVLSLIRQNPTLMATLGQLERQ